MANVGKGLGRERAERILGPLTEREKTDVRLPSVLARQVDAVCEVMGVPKNAFFAMAAAQMCVQLSHLEPGGDRAVFYRRVDDMLQQMIVEVRSHAAEGGYKKHRGRSRNP